MANEISITVTGTLTNGNLRRRIEPGTKQINQTAQGHDGGTVALTTAITQITVGSVTTLGWAFFQNVSASGVIYLGPHSTTLVPAHELRAGEHVTGRLIAGTTMAARTVSGAANLLVELWQD